MENSRIIKYLNDNKFTGRNFVSEIRCAKIIEFTESTALRFYVTIQEFISDSYGDGFHKSSFKTIDISDINLKKMRRDLNIDSLLDDDGSFDIESILYSDEKLERLNKLRYESSFKLPKIRTMYDYYSSFKKGDKVYLNNESGVITYCHKPNSKGELKFTVNVHGKETKFINPFEKIFIPYSRYEKTLYLSKRKVTNYEMVEVPEHVKELDTKKLLNILDYCRKGAWVCVPDNIDEMHIRAELSTREHVTSKKESKKKRVIAKKHGGSKSKNR